MARENPNPLYTLFVDEPRDLYSAERPIVSALPKMAKKTMHDQLRGAFERHLDETKGHVARLERIGDELDVSIRGKTCKGVEGLVEEGKDVISDFDDQARDAALVGAAQKVEHCEIAAYGTARTHANMGRGSRRYCSRRGTKTPGPTGR